MRTSKLCLELWPNFSCQRETPDFQLYFWSNSHHTNIKCTLRWHVVDIISYSLFELATVDEQHLNYRPHNISNVYFLYQSFWTMVYLFVSIQSQPIWSDEDSNWVGGTDQWSVDGVLEGASSSSPSSSSSYISSSILSLDLQTSPDWHRTKHSPLWLNLHLHQQKQRGSSRWAFSRQRKGERHRRRRWDTEERWKLFWKSNVFFWFGNLSCSVVCDLR